VETHPVDTRVSLTKGQFLKIYRWQQQMPLTRLAALAELSIKELANLESDAPLTTGRGPDCDRLTTLLGCASDIWERVGVDPGFPGTSAGAESKTAPKGLITLAAHINRIAAMPEGMRQRQMQVIQRELGYIDA
jgi:hypothetical protein